jgi:hypothetical protein
LAGGLEGASACWVGSSAFPSAFSVSTSACGNVRSWNVLEVPHHHHNLVPPPP